MDQELAQTIANNIMINKKWKDFIRRFDVDAVEKGYFSMATFELTAFCTLKCPMCNIRIDQKSAIALSGRLRTAREWIDMAKQFRDQSGIFLLLTGGEPMMRPDFPEIYEEVSKLGLYITLFTNGTTVDDKMLELLKRRPPAMIGLTIYGSSEETYRKFGSSEGTFQRAIDGLDRLLTIPNLALEVKFTACRDNYKDYKGVYELVAKRNMLVSFDSATYAPVRGACSDARKLRLTEAQHKELSNEMKQLFKSSYDEYERLIGRETYSNTPIKKLHDTTSPDERCLQCDSGKQGVYIAWDGRMYPCDLASYPFTFPFEQGFREAASDIRRQVGSLIYPERCLTCANKETTCSCIPKAQNEMRDCARVGERCNHIPKASLK